MTSLPGPSPADFPDSPYARELQRADPAGRFRPDLEAEYSRQDLASKRGLIRTICGAAVLLSVGHGAEQLATGHSGGLLLAELGTLVLSSGVLASLSWSAAFGRWYRPAANLLVPLRSVAAAAHFAAGAVAGEVWLLITLPVMVISAFFFLGLRLRAALIAATLTAVSFAGCALLYGVELPLTVRCCMYLAVTLIGCVIAVRQLEKCSRRSFLEGHLIAEMAQRDALTGTRNRRVFDERLTRIWHLAAADGSSIAILLIDVDHFKAYNDRYGHLAGDEALREVARAVQRFVHRPLDVLARYGGEEFAVILYDITGKAARTLAERMRCAVQDLGIEHLDSPTSETVTISVGVAAIEPTLERESRGALQLADQALYEAKTQGRNTVQVLDEAEYQVLVTGIFPSGPPGLARPNGRRGAPRTALYASPAGRAR